MKKLSKVALAKLHLKDINDNFRESYQKCLDNNIHITPECIVDKTKWRIIIEFKDSEGGVTERKASDDSKDPKTYTSIKDYELKIMELYVHYAKSL